MATDTSKHLTALRIQNFKRFRDFELDNIGQFNLVVGKNNTGKTSLLEALLVDELDDAWDILEKLALAYKWRSFEYKNYRKAVEAALGDSLSNEFVWQYEYQHSDNTVDKVRIALGPFDLERDYLRIENMERNVYTHGTRTSSAIYTLEIEHDDGRASISTNIIPKVEQEGDDFGPFIEFGIGYHKDLMSDYLVKIGKSINHREKFIRRMQLFIPEVVDVRLSDSIDIYIEGEDLPTVLTSYGAATVKLFRILCEISLYEGERLMIDEIDAGIHYTKFKEFWKVVMQAASEYDVQIFATTHNEECVDYFQEALEELTEHSNKGRIIQLRESKDNEIKARVYDLEGMRYARETGRELRGGRV